MLISYVLGSHQPAWFDLLVYHLLSAAFFGLLVFSIAFWCRIFKLYLSCGWATHSIKMLGTGNLNGTILIYLVQNRRIWGTPFFQRNIWVFPKNNGKTLKIIPFVHRVWDFETIINHHPFWGENPPTYFWKQEPKESVGPFGAQWMEVFKMFKHLLMSSHLYRCISSHSNKQMNSKTGIFSSQQEMTWTRWQFDPTRSLDVCFLHERHPRPGTLPYRHPINAVFVHFLKSTGAPSGCGHRMLSSRKLRNCPIFRSLIKL